MFGSNVKNAEKKDLRTDKNYARVYRKTKIWDNGKKVFLVPYPVWWSWSCVTQTPLPRTFCQFQRVQWANSCQLSTTLICPLVCPLKLRSSWGEASDGGGIQSHIPFMTVQTMTEQRAGRRLQPFSPDRGLQQMTFAPEFPNGPAETLLIFALQFDVHCPNVRSS